MPRDDAEADVPLLADCGLARVQSHAHPYPAAIGPLVLGQGPLGNDRGPHGCVRACKGEEERVSLRVDLTPTVALGRLADDALVLAQDLAVAGAEPLQECRRALDVREEEGDGSGR